MRFLVTITGLMALFVKASSSTWRPRANAATSDTDHATGSRPSATQPTRDSEPYRTARALLPDRFAEFETKRFIILSDADVLWTREQAGRLERAHFQFERFVKRMKFDAVPLRHKLVVVLFRDRSDYRRFAQAHDGVSDPRMGGYYAPAADRSAFYDVESSPDMLEARTTLDEMHNRARELDHETRRAGTDEELNAADREHARAYRQHVEQETERVEQFAIQATISTTIHEAIHHLFFHTGIQSPHVQHPVWLSEGLATAFETDRPNEAFGPQREYEPRRRRFLKLLEEDRLLPLRELVTIAEITTIYNQSYALVTWLYRYRDKDLARFIEGINALPPGRPDESTYLRVFEAAFGDLERLERQWLRDERRQLDG